MYQTILVLVAGLLTLPPALTMPCAYQQPGSISCQTLGGGPASVPDGPIAVADLKLNMPVRRFTPIEFQTNGLPAAITQPTHEGPSGMFQGQGHDEMGPYHLAAGTYQIHIRWIGDFIPGKTHPSRPIPSPSNGSEGENPHHVHLADERRLTRAVATLWVTPKEDDPSPDLLDIVTCPGTSLRRPLHADRPVDFDLRLTDDYGMPDGSFDRRPSRASARWWIAAEGSRASG